MTFLILSFLTSLIVTLLVVRSAEKHAHHSADHDLSGPQKFHSTPVPRVGGVGVFVAMLAGVALSQFTGRAETLTLWLLVLCCLPTSPLGHGRRPDQDPDAAATPEVHRRFGRACGVAA